MEKRRKELAFLAVGVLLLGAALYTTFKPRTEPASADKPKQVAEAPKAQPDEPREMEEPTAVDEGPVAAEKPSATKEPAASAHRDPFAGKKPGMRLSSTGGSLAKPVQMSAVRSFPMPPMLGPGTAGPQNTFGTLPFAGMLGGNMGLPQPGATTSGTPSATGSRGTPPVDNTLRVTGIIEGNPTVAILRKGEARYIVQTGDPVLGYVVESISGRRVVLAAGGEKKSLFLGGRL
jgi:hypothetical protein